MHTRLAPFSLALLWACAPTIPGADKRAGETGTTTTDTVD